MEEMLIESALRSTGGNQVQAAKILGVSRNTLANKMKKYKIS
jgi:DNA-binding protein Fis